MNIPSIKECVDGPVKFEYYRDDVFYYRCANGFLFGIPHADTKGATFLVEDKGMFFMRWIRKFLEDIKQISYVMSPEEFDVFAKQAFHGVK